MNKRQAKKKAKKEANRQRDAIEALKKLPGIADELRRAFRELLDKIHERNIESLKEIYGEHKEEEDGTN